VDEPIVLTEAEQLDAIRESLPALSPEQLIVEPSPRGTANALGLAALTLLERDPDALMLSSWADQVIRGDEAFVESNARALEVAERSGSLVTVGLRPRYPATGLGYIRAGEPAEGRATFEAAEFVEKPDAERAAAFMEAGVYFWNLGLFAWRCSTFVEELRAYAPQSVEGIEAVLEARRRGDTDLAARRYRELPEAVVDYVVLEKSRRLLLVVADFEWLDVGSWSELYETLRHDAAGNAIDAETVLIDTTGSLVSSRSRLVAAIGVNDLVIIDADDALLVCPRSRTQDVRKVVEKLREKGKIKYL
jgi:mannose-1-phosphate guanylyltransferase/mannose-6-phosphate isomerase